MAEQLQLGEIERLDGLGNPLGAIQPPSDSQSVQGEAQPQQAVAAPVEEEAPWDNYLDGTVDGFSDLTGDAMDLVELPTDGQLSGAAEIYNMAMVSNSKHITPEDVMDMVKRDITPFDVQSALAAIQEQSPEYRKLVAYNMIGDARLTVEAKMDLLRYMDTIGKERDVNYVSKQAQVNAASADYMNDDEPDAEQALAHQYETVAMQGTTVEPSPALPEDIYADIKQLYQEAENQESFLDYVEQMTPVGSLPTLNKVLADIYSDLGLSSEEPDVSDGTTQARPWLLAGNAFVELRGMIRQADPQQRADIAKVIYNRLRQNTGIMQDHNDLVTLQVLGNLFSEEIYGQDQYAYEEELSGADLQKAQAELEALRKKYPKFAPGGAGEARNEQELAAYRRIIELEKQTLRIPGLGTIGDNIFNLLDWTAVGGLLKGLGKTIRATPKLLGRMADTAPETAARKAAEGVLDDSGEAAARLGTTPLDLADNFLVNGADDVAINRGVNGFAAMTQQMQEQVRALVRSLQPVNLTATERYTALADITKQFDPQILAKSQSVKLHLNQSSVQLSEDGTAANVSAIFGATPYRGYASVRRAREASRTAVEDVFGKDAPVEIVRRTPEGKWEIIPEGSKGNERGEFFLRVRDSRSLSATESYGTIALADDATDKLTLSSGAAHWTRGLNVFNDFHYDQISARVRQASFSNTVWRGLMEPLTRLKTSDKQLLSKIIRENEGTELADDALELAAGGNRKVMDGYRRFNQIGNIAYHLEDQLKRTAYMREGLSDLYHNNQRIGFGKPLSVDEAAGGSRKKVFNPETGQYTTMQKADIETLYKRGGSLAKMKHPVRGSENIEDALVLIDYKMGKVRPVPMSGVQAKIPGYYPHMYNRNFIVYAVDKTGRRVPKAISFTQRSAADYVTRKNAQLKVVQRKGRAQNWVRYEMGYDPALSKSDTYAQHLDELESGFSQVMFGQRGEAPLRQLDSWVEEAELDPVAAMLRATEILSTRVTKGEMLQSMRQRVWNSLHTGANKQFLKAGSEKKSYNQLTLDDLVEAHPDVDGLKRHQAMLHRIRLMEQTPDFWENVTKGSYRGMAQLSQKLGFKGAEIAGYKLAKNGPNPVSMGLAWLHRMYISAFATKQLVLQVMQSVATAGLLSPAQYTKAVRQGMSIIPAVILKTADLHGARWPGAVGFSHDLLRADDFLHKAVGLEKREFNRLIQVIIERGLIDSVGANTMVKAAINDAAEAAARRRASIPKKGVSLAIENVRDALGPLAPLTRVRTYDQAVFGTLNKLGWEGGERVNQILSMLTLYNRDKAAGVAKLFDEAYVDSLIGRTAELTGNMVKEAGFGYTNSVLKPFMLWVPFQHKMILQALPKRIGGMQRFSANEKARMVFGQFLLYGANATAITAGVHQAIERGIVEKLEAQPEGEKNAFVQFWRSSIARDALEGMVFDWMGNKTMMALWGRDASVPNEMDWGRAFAPGAGHEYVREKVTALASADWKGALGVQGNYASKLARYMTSISNVVSARMGDYDDMPMKERMGQMIQRGAVDLVPIYGKWLTARWAVAHGMFISENGTLSEPFGDEIEAKLQWLLGVDSKDRAAYYEATDRLRMDFEDSDKATKAGEEAADIYWKQLITTAVKTDKELPSDDMWQAAMDQWMLDQGLMLSVLGAREKEAFSKRIESKIDKLAAGQGDSAEMVMMERFTNKLRDGGYGDKGPVAAVYFKHLPFVEKNPQFMDMLEAAWNDIVYAPEPENITEDYLEGED